eukprot:356364-Prymnesium_polylepis.1
MLLLPARLSRTLCAGLRDERAPARVAIRAEILRLEGRARRHAPLADRRGIWCSSPEDERAGLLIAELAALAVHARADA